MHIGRTRIDSEYRNEDTRQEEDLLKILEESRKILQREVRKRGKNINTETSIDETRC